MRKATGLKLLAVVLPGIVLGATRVYDVDVYQNVNGWTLQGQQGYVSQSFVCTADSLLWAEFFVGAADTGGQYQLDIKDGPNGPVLYRGFAHAGDSVHYKYTRAELTPYPGAPKLIKGKTYCLKVTHSDGDSINFYYSPWDPYQYGIISVPGGSFQPPPQVYSPDLCARIEGVSRAVSREFFGINADLQRWFGTRPGPLNSLLTCLDSAGIRWCRDGPDWYEVQAVRQDSFDWSHMDGLVAAADSHGIHLMPILGCAPAWASSDTGEPPDTESWVLNCYPPLNLDSAPLSPSNYYGQFVYSAVSRYATCGVHDWEVWNEPQWWRPPKRGYDSLRAQFGSDTVGLAEYLYARLCVVACSAARAADPGVRMIVGGGLGDVFDHSGSDGTVDGAAWLAGFYQYGGCGGMDSGASVHPYQADWPGLHPGTFDSDLDTIRTVRRIHGDEGKQLLVTEAAYGQDGIQAAISLPETYTLSLAGSPLNFYDRVFWIPLWADSTSKTVLIRITDNSSGFSIERMPCYYAFQQMTEELAGKRVNGRVLSGNPATDSVSRVYELEDTANGKKTWVAWRNYETGAGAVSLKVPIRTELLDTNYLKRAGSDNQHRYVVHAGADGWFQINVDTIPVYVFENPSETPSRPDLAVDSIWTSFVPGSVTPQKRRLWARIRNVGNAATGGGQALTLLKFYANGTQATQVICPSIIQPGDTARVEGDDVWQISGSNDQMVKTVVNEGRVFVELNWDNNSRFRLFHILPILGSQGGVNGPRTMARATGSSPIQAVAEFSESGNPLVFYCRSLDSATSGWDSLTTGKYPAIGLAGGSPWVTFTRGDTVIGMVYNGSAWRTKVIFTPALGQHVGPAALTVFQSRGQWKGTSAALGQVVFPVYQSGNPMSFILHARWDTLSACFDTLDKVSIPTDRDSCVTLCSGGYTDTLHAAYSRNTTTCYRTARYDTVSAQTSFWSSAKQFGGGIVVAVHPYLEQFKDRVWLVFRRTVNGNTAIMRVSHDVATTYSNWTGGSPVSNDNLVPKDFPVLSTNEVAAWSEGTANNWHIRARVRDSIADLSQTDSIANHPHVLADTSVTDGPSRDRLRVRGIWACKSGGDTWLEAYSDRNFDRSAAAANATESNNGRKLVKQTGSNGTTLHMVYHTQAGAVYYAEAPSGTDQWTRTNLDGGDLPCLDLGQNRLWVAYRNDSSPGIKCQTRSTDSTAWQELTVLDCGGTADSTEPGAPAIIGARSDPKGQGKTAAYCVFALQNHQVDSSFVVLVKLTQNGVQDTDTLDRAALGQDSLPAISAGTGDFLSVAWQKGTEIYYRVSTDSVRPDTNPPITWSSAYNLSNTQTRSRHAALESSPETLLAVWSEGDTGRIMAKGQATGSAYNAWGDAVTLSSDSNPCDYPNVPTGDGDNDSVVVVWQVQTGTNTRIINARVNFGNTLTIVARDDPVAFPHIAFETAIQDSDTVCYIHCAYSEEPSSNYHEACCDRYDLSGGGGGGGQSAGLTDPNIHPALFRPAPNPFNGQCCIRYCTNVKGMTRVTVMDITGRRVRNLLTMPQKPGIYNLTWNARDDRARQLPRGVYFVRLETANYNEARKVVLE